MLFSKFVFIAITLFPHFVFSGSIPPPPVSKKIAIRKCCKNNQLYRDDAELSPCQLASNITDPFEPSFFDPSATEKLPTSYELVYGIPNCVSRNPWRVYGNPYTCDKLKILPDGKLRHYASDRVDVETCQDDISEEERWQDYNISEYCIDRVIFSGPNSSHIGEIALVCVPTHEIPWHDTHFVMLRIVNPISRAIAIVCLLIVAIIYVVLPQLCDLVGNIITTITVCLVFVQVAEIIQIYDEYHSEMSYLVSNSVMYVSSLGAFFWLNSLGYYIWKTFRSRNVFLRVTDGRKYCCYAAYSWGATFSMAAMALFAHLVLNSNVEPKRNGPVTDAAIADLGAAVFLTTIAYTITVNIFFCLSTLHIMSGMSTYGRIHHKLKSNFHLFVKLFIIITTNWFIFILSWFNVRGLLYLHIVANLLQAMAVLYVTVLSVHKIRYLLSKACCHEKCIFTCCRPGDPGDISEWGEEMMAMNTRS